jgi:hypothetical protein
MFWRILLANYVIYLEPFIMNKYYILASCVILICVYISIYKLDHAIFSLNNSCSTIVKFDGPNMARLHALLKNIFSHVNVSSFVQIGAKHHLTWQMKHLMITKTS